MTSINFSKVSFRGLLAPFFLFFLALCLSTPAFATYTGFEGYDENVSIDLPEGFELVDSSDNNIFILQSSIVPVKALIRIYTRERFADTGSALLNVMNSLKVDYEQDNFTWRGYDSSLAVFDGNLEGVNSYGFATCTVLPDDDSVIVLITWCPYEQAPDCTPLMVSFHDSLCIDNGSFYETGLLTRYAFPLSHVKQDVLLEIDGKAVATELKDNDVEASEYLIKREYMVLELYAQSPLWQKAWQRFYRMIYRDSFDRLKKPAFDICNALAPECEDATEIAQKLLTWVQGFKYERKQDSTDFTSLPAVLLGNGSDCDSRSLLVALLLRSMNEDAIMFVSAVYSHAVAGFVSTHPGFGFTVDGKTYLTGETTVQGLTWGKIAQEQADQNAWIEVLLP